MKIVKPRKLFVSKKAQEAQKKVAAKENLKKYSDEYKDEVDPVDVQITEHTVLNVSCRRGGDYGLPFVNMRIFYRSDATDNEYRPTKTGLTFKLEMLESVIEALQKIDERCHKKKVGE